MSLFIVYASDVEGQAIEAVFEATSSDERRLKECALLPKRHAIDAQRNSSTMRSQRSYALQSHMESV